MVTIPIYIFALIVLIVAGISFFIASLCLISSVSDLQQENNFYQEMLLIKQREIKEYEKQFGVISFDDDGIPTNGHNVPSSEGVGGGSC